MHELGIAQSVVEICEREAAGASVRRVVLEVGALAAVLPDALQLSFQLASSGTCAEGAVLELRQLPARGRCVSCGVEREVSDLLAECPCGMTAYQWLSGHELAVRQLEVA